MGDNTYPELTLETWMYRLCGVDVGMYCQKHPRLLHLFYNIHTLVFIHKLTLPWALPVLDISSIKRFSYRIIDVLCHWSLVYDLVCHSLSIPVH